MRPHEILEQAKVIAVVGASPDRARPSHEIMRYLIDHGFDVVPIRPGCDAILGLPCYPDLASVGRPIDVVDVFRRSEAAAGVAREAAAIGVKALWLQEGVRSEEARQIAEEAGMEYVEDRCIKLVHLGTG